MTWEYRIFFSCGQL